MQELVREVIVAPHVQDYAIRLVLATHPEGPFAADVTNQYLRWGSSPRGVQTLVLAAKVRALLDGRYNVSFDDIRRVYLPACGTACSSTSRPRPRASIPTTSCSRSSTPSPRRPTRRPQPPRPADRPLVGRLFPRDGQFAIIEE